MKRFLERRLPPGYPLKTELYAVLAAAIWSALSVTAGFLREYSFERQALFVRRGVDLLLDESRVMPDFADILGNRLQTPLAFAAMIFVCASAAHYAHYYSGGKSIYTMRRLPRPLELHTRSVTVPLLCALAFVLMAAAMLAVFYAVYMVFTPEACLAPGQLQKIWSVML